MEFFIRHIDVQDKKDRHKHYFIRYIGWFGQIILHSAVHAGNGTESLSVGRLDQQADSLSHLAPYRRRREIRLGD